MRALSFFCSFSHSFCLSFSRYLSRYLSILLALCISSVSVLSGGCLAVCCLSLFSVTDLLQRLPLALSLSLFPPAAVAAAAAREPFILRKAQNGADETVERERERGR